MFVLLVIIYVLSSWQWGAWHCRKWGAPKRGLFEHCTAGWNRRLVPRVPQRPIFCNALLGPQASKCLL